MQKKRDKRKDVIGWSDKGRGQGEDRHYLRWSGSRKLLSPLMLPQTLDMRGVEERTPGINTRRSQPEK